MKLGIVDVGGGYRGIYAAGVLDYCMEHQISFDLGIGVSAGSCNLLSFAARQPGRNRKFYSEFGLRREYAGIGNFITKKSFVDLNYVEALSCAEGEYPLDYPAIAQSPMELYIVATEARTGNARYFGKNQIRQDHYEVMKASCALPVVCHPYTVDGIPYFDGALSDPVPVEKAFGLGCDRVVLLLTRPESEALTPERDDRLAHLLRLHYPEAAEHLRLHAQRYQEGIVLAQAYRREGKLLIVSPDDTCGVRTLSRDANALDRLYQKGYADGEQIQCFLRR